MIERIYKRIEDLKAEKEELLREYPNTSADLLDTLAERNSRINLELIFLNELIKFDDIKLSCDHNAMYRKEEIIAGCRKCGKKWFVD